MTAFEAWARAGAALAMAAALGGTALAAPAAAPGRVPAVQKLTECRGVADNTQRLACYDQAAAMFDQAEAKGDIVVVDREQARKVRRQAFGFTMPSLSLFERGEKSEDLETVTGVVQSAQRLGSGRWTVRLEDGAIWTQVDTTEIPRDPRSGQPVKIRRASMGSYMMSVGNQGSVRVRREQ